LIPGAFQVKEDVSAAEGIIDPANEENQTVSGVA
jgi:hypothetical protein